MIKISLKYILIHIHNFEPSRVIMNIKLSSHGFLLHRNINRRDCTLFIFLLVHLLFRPCFTSLKVLPVQDCLGSVGKSICLLNPWPTFSYAMKQNTLGFGSEPKGTLLEALCCPCSPSVCLVLSLICLKMIKDTEWAEGSLFTHSHFLKPSMRAVGNWWHARNY